MSSTPSIFSPVTLSKAWFEIFEAKDQWEDVGKFYDLHTRDLNTVQGHRRLCSPKVGHLLALRTGGVQLVHNIHQEEVDDFHGNDEGKIWALREEPLRPSSLERVAPSTKRQARRTTGRQWLNGKRRMTSLQRSTRSRQARRRLGNRQRLPSEAKLPVGLGRRDARRER